MRLSSGGSAHRLMAMSRGAFRRNDLVTMFGALMATRVVTTLVGFVYWTVAARALPAKEVGLAAAATSAMTFLATFAMLGIGTLLISELPTRVIERQAPLFSTGLMVTGFAGAALGVAGAVVAPHLAASLAATGGSLLTVAVFTTGVAATAVSTVFDEAVLGLRRERAQLLRNSIASVSKLALLVAAALVGLRSGEAMVAGWVAGLVASVLIGLLSLRLGRQPRWRTTWRGRIRDARLRVSRARRHYSLNLALEGSGYLLPVVVSLVTPPHDVAYFSTARLISGAVLTVPFMLTIALFASTAGHEASLGPRVRQSVSLGLILASAAAGIVAVTATPVMSIFGEEYASGGASLLRLLALTGPALVLKDHYIAIQRVRGKLRVAAAFAVAATALEVAAAWTGGANFGTEGLCAAWLMALFVEACAVLPLVMATARTASGQEVQLATWRVARAFGTRRTSRFP